MSPRPEALFFTTASAASSCGRRPTPFFACVRGFLLSGSAWGLHEPSTGASAHGPRGAGLTTVKPSVELPDGGGVEKPVVPVLVSPSRKDGDDLSALKEVRMGFSIGTGYLAEFAVQWNSIELAWCHFRRRMIHPIVVPNNEVRSPSAMTSETYSSRLGIP